MTASAVLENAVEHASGLSVAELRGMPIDERREQVEKKTGKVLQIVSFFPFIGRGNVLRDRLLTNKQVEQGLYRALFSRPLSGAKR